MAPGVVSGERRTVEVWSGVWTASPGPPRPGDRWDRSELVEEKHGRAYVHGRGGSLWVAPSHWREVS